MGRVATARSGAARAPNPLAATLLKVCAALPPVPRDPDPTPSFLPRPGAAWRTLRDAWVAKRGGEPGMIEPGTTIPRTTIADVVEIANHVTASLRNDVGRVDEATGTATWNYWRERVKLIRTIVGRATDGTARYPRNEVLWASELRRIAMMLADSPRNARPGADREGASAPQPTIVKVEIETTDGERATAPTRSFASLADADAALSRRFARTPPPPDGHVTIGFVVTWSDDRTSSGRLDVTPTVVAEAASRGGMLRTYLFDLGRWVLSERHAREWRRYFGDRNPSGLAARRAWGDDLLNRLAVDSAALGYPGARRNHREAMSYAGGGVPDFRPTKSAAAMLAGVTTLLPNPPTVIASIWQRYRDANGPDDRSRDEPPPPLLAVRDLVALTNVVTAALRRDLLSLVHRDAAVIWKKWRDVALDLRVEVRGRDPHEWSTYRAFPLRLQRLADDLATAVRAPGTLFEAFCPWREAFFTTDEVRPDQRAGNWRRSPIEVNAWLP